LEVGTGHIGAIITSQCYIHIDPVQTTVCPVSYLINLRVYRGFLTGEQGDGNFPTEKRKAYRKKTLDN
jgi:hypothetical protein